MQEGPRANKWRPPPEAVKSQERYLSWDQEVVVTYSSPRTRTRIRDQLSLQKVGGEQEGALQSWAAGSALPSEGKPL